MYSCIYRERDLSNVYQFSSLKHVMMSSRAEGSIYNIWFFEGICLNDYCIPRCSSPECSTTHISTKKVNIKWCFLWLENDGWIEWNLPSHDDGRSLPCRSLVNVIVYAYDFCLTIVANRISLCLWISIRYITGSVIKIFM